MSLLLGTLSRRLLTLLLFTSSALSASTVISFPGTTVVSNDAAPQLIPVTLPRGGTIQSIQVLTQGNPNFDFSLSGGGTCTPGLQYVAGQQCTVSIGFHPKFPGQRRGAVILLDSSRRPLASQTLVAYATGSVATFIPGIITTVAGDATWIYSGDGSPATGSSIFLPFGITVDTAGNIFLADSGNSRIRRVDAISGAISTVAGNGLIGSAGEAGPATSASLNNPTSVALDSAGNIFFSDSGNNLVRRIDAFTGILTTVAGSLGTHGYSGDAGPATAAGLNSPNGLALDGDGNLYIADSGNNVIRLVNSSTGLISTVAGNNVAGFSGDSGPALSASLNNPWSIALAPTGELYIADQNNHRIRLVARSGTISTFAGLGSPGFSGDLGPAADAQLNVPAAVAIDVAGNVYIADSGNNRIRKVNAQSSLIITIAGNGAQSFQGDYGPANQASLYGPYGLALDNQGSLFIADVFHNRVRKVAANSAAIIFDPIRVGRISNPRSQLLENDGNAALTPQSITAVSNSQLDPVYTTCSNAVSLPSLGTCFLSVAFAPTVTGNPAIGTVLLASDAANAPSQVVLVGQVLDTDPSTVTLTSNTNPSNTGSTITFNVTASSAGTTPTGNILLLDGATVIVNSSLQAGGKVTFNVSSLSAGQHSISASYVGDASNAPGVSTPLLQVVTQLQASTVTGITASASPVDAGAPLTLSAQVAVATPGSGTGPLTGNVTFSDGTRIVGTATLISGTATLSATSLSVGIHSLTAAYLGTSSYAPSTSGVLTETVNLATTHIALSTNANPSNAGASVTLTAAIFSTGGAPSGPITFLDQGKSLGSATLNSQGIATLVVAGTLWSPAVHTLTATYPGDASDGPSASQPLTQTVNLATSTLLLLSSLNPSPLGSSVTFTVAANSNGGTPTGPVSFFDGTSLLGSSSLSTSGAATLTTSALTLGLHSITVTYSGDPYDSPATSPAFTEVIQATSIAISLASSANPASFNSPLTFSIIVTGSGNPPSGTITLTDGGGPLASLSLSPAGSASFVTSALTIGTHTILAVYSGDATHSPVSATVLTQHIVQATVTTLSPGSARVIAGLPATLTANVSGTSSRPTSGPIVFSEGAATLATLNPDTSGNATFTTSALTPGVHTVVATYAGDSLNAPSTSAPSIQTIAAATTNVALSSSANPSFTGSPLTISATVSGTGATPTGSVLFSDGPTPLATVPLTQNGIAVLSLTSLSPGIHQLTASYSGDPDDSPNTSAVLSQQIAARTSITISSSANPSLLTDTITLTITVTNGASIPPTGAFTLMDNGSALPTPPLDAAGRATVTLNAPSLGSHTLLATYAGDPGNIPASSLPFLQTVTLRPTATTFSASSTNLSAGDSLVLISVVQGSGSQAPTGHVTFESGSTILGSSAISSSGLASISLTAAQATLNVTAVYSGDGLFATSTSPAIIIVVGPPIQFSISTPGSLTLQSGQHGTLQVNIATAATFVDMLSLGCAGLPTSATCTFSTSQLAVGGGLPKTVTLTVDTGNPLGAGSVASIMSSGPLLCLLPAALLLGVLGRRRMNLKLLAVLFSLAAFAALSGCASSFSQNSTPPGTYSFQVFARGQQSAATQVATVQLTVTK